MEYIDILPENGNYEFFRSPKDSQTMVICLHGYSGSSYEVKDLGKHLYDLGFSTLCPLLPGHGIKDPEFARREFSTLTTEKLLSFVMELIEEYKALYSKVILHGLSMGGMISLYIASQGHVDGAIITSTPLVMPWKSKIIFSGLGLFNLTLKMPKPLSEQEWGYDFMCTRSIRSLNQLMKLANENMGNIKVPTLFCYSHSDPLVAGTENYYVEKNLPPNAEMRWFDEPGHVILVGEGADRVIDAIGEFSQEHFS